MPKLPLLSSAYKDKSKTYNIPLLQSYAGYPVVSAKSLGLEDYFAKEGKGVGGMAWGGKTNVEGQGGGSPSSIVPNPYYYKNNPSGQNALVVLEASRHWMDENDYKPSFKITEEMQKWRAKNFNNAGPAGESYRTNDDAFRKTIISRFVGGDSNVPPITSELKKDVVNVQQKLENADAKLKPTISQSIMSMMGMKNKSMK